MAHTFDTSYNPESSEGTETKVLDAHSAERLELPSSAFVTDADMVRDGADLHLTTHDGQSVTIEGYFDAEPSPLLQSPDGSTLSPELVKSFAHSAYEFAANDVTTDESPVAAVTEVQGQATILHPDGTRESIAIGTPVHQGDVIETATDGAVNITFVDETSMALSQNARFAVDQYTYDPQTESGTTNFSVLRGLFVFTSGLIGRDDPDDVKIETPVGSIGIRGTIIAGQIVPDGESNITVMEGAIVVRNGASETTLSDQFQTVQLRGYNEPIHDLGVVNASEITNRFSSIGSISPSLFASVHDAAHEQNTTSEETQDSESTEQDGEESEKSTESKDTENKPQNVQSPDQPEAKENTPDNEEKTDKTTETLSDDAVDQKDVGRKDFALQERSTSENTLSKMAAVQEAPATTGSSVSESSRVSPVVTKSETALTPTPVVSVREESVSPTVTLKVDTTTLYDTADEGNVVATLSLTGYRRDAGYTFGSGGLESSSGYFKIEATSHNTAVIKLTALGAEKLHGTLDTVQLGGFSIKATLKDGTVLAAVLTPTVQDANASSNIALDSDPSHPRVAYLLTGTNKAHYAFSAIGDVDNDGFDDFVLVESEGTTKTVYTVKGTSSFDAFTDKTTETGSTYGEKVNPSFKIAGIGDYNNDGSADWISAQSYSDSIYKTLLSTPDSSHAAQNTSGGTFDIDGIGDFNNDGKLDIIYTGSNSVKIKSDDGTLQTINAPDGALAFGASVAGIGDINGDGFNDVAIGAPSTGSGAGAAYIYYGNEGGGVPTRVTLTDANIQKLGENIHYLGDVNSDGYSDIILMGDGDGFLQLGGAPFSPSNRIYADLGDDYSIGEAGAVGDYNGDGFDDFALSLSDGTGTKFYVVYGKENFSGSLTLDYLKDPLNAQQITSTTIAGEDEFQIGRLGDLNGDGYDEFGISVIRESEGDQDGMYVVYGAGGTTSARIDTATATMLNIVGTAGVDTSLSDGGIDHVSIRGGAGNDILSITKDTFRNLDGGTGNDILKISGSLDFSNVNFEQISGIEKITFAGSNQTLFLTLENLFNLAKTSDTGDLKITSDDCCNTIVLDATGEIEDWTSQVSGGQTTYTLGNYSLTVDNDITVSIPV